MSNQGLISKGQLKELLKTHTELLEAGEYADLRQMCKELLDDVVEEQKISNHKFIVCKQLRLCYAPIYNGWSIILDGSSSYFESNIEFSSDKIIDELTEISDRVFLDREDNMFNEEVMTVVNKYFKYEEFNGIEIDHISS